MKNVRLARFAAAVLTTAVAFTATAASVDRTFVITSTPPGATVTVTADRKTQTVVTPATLKPITIRSDVPAVFEIVREGYATQQKSIDYELARKLASSSSTKITNDFNLVEILRGATVAISANVEGADVFINDRPAGTAPVRTNLTFNRASGEAPWSSIKIRLDKSPKYKTAETNITADAAAANARAEGGWKLKLNLDEIRRDVPVTFKADQNDARVLLDGVLIGLTPYTTNIVFQRADGGAAWPIRKVRIEKDDFEMKPPGNFQGEPAYTNSITADWTPNKEMMADPFFQVRFVTVPVRSFQVLPDKVLTVKTNALSEVRPSSQQNSGTPYVTISGDRRFYVLSRISVVQEMPSRIFYTFPHIEPRAGTNLNEEISGANIYSSEGDYKRTAVTTGQFYDLDPVVSPNGKYLYFSTDRSPGKRIIMRTPSNSETPRMFITGTSTVFDTEPAVSPDGERVAYTSRQPGAAPGTPSSIWIIDAEGKGSPSQYWEGHSASWSPDGKSIVYVSSREKVMLVPDVDAGGNPQQITTGDSHESWPIFAGGHILYASDKGVAGYPGRQFSLYSMKLDGTSEVQITNPGSFDAMPATDKEGKYLYFFSNRGAAKSGQEYLQIFRVDLLAK